MIRDEKAKKKIKEAIVICICGMAGSGKSTLAKKLAEKYGLKYCSGGDALKALAKEEGYKPIEKGWWETKEGMQFLEERKKDSKFDMSVDKKFSDVAEEGNVIFDSWAQPWLLKKGFKIWLESSLKERAERIANRDGIGVREALKALRNMEERTTAIYKKLYGFSLGEDFTPFNLILDTDNLKAGEVFQVLCKVIDNVVVNSDTTKTLNNTQNCN